MSRMPALLKLGMGGAGAAAVAGVVAVIAVAMQDSGPSGPLEPGVWLAVSGPVHETQIRLVQVDGDAPERQLPPEMQWETLSWSPRGQRLLGVAWDLDTELMSARMIDLESGEVTAEATHPAITPRPIWSPDGRYVAFEPRTTAEGGGQLGILDRESGELAVVAPIARWGDDAALDSAFGGRSVAWAPDSSKVAFVHHQGIVAMTPDGAVIDASSLNEWFVRLDGENPQPVGVRNFEWESAARLRIYLNASRAGRLWIAGAEVTNGGLTWRTPEDVGRSTVRGGEGPPCTEHRERLEAAYGPFKTWYGDIRWCDKGRVTAIAASKSEDVRQPEDIAALVLVGEDVYRVDLEPPPQPVDPRLWSLATDAVRIE